MLLTNPTIIFKFDKNTDISNWLVVDDVVMGGRSNGNFTLSEKGNGHFYGEVSTENNGGFSSLRYRFEPINVDKFTKIKIRLKGDKKQYQFRIKSDVSQRHAYISHFQTSGDWETIELNLKDLYPTFRGVELDMPNFSNDTFEQIAFLIANKKDESFSLEIEKIELE